VIVVHGGGKQIKQYLEQFHIPSQFHNGLRVTDSAAMQVVQMVLAGLVNKNIVAAFIKDIGRRWGSVVVMEGALSPGSIEMVSLKTLTTGM
jgi:acetylglutamate kinase